MLKQADLTLEYDSDVSEDEYDEKAFKECLKAAEELEESDPWNFSGERCFWVAREMKNELLIIRLHFDNAENAEKYIYVIIDSGSTISLISQAMVNKWNLESLCQVDATKVTAIQGFNNKTTKTHKYLPLASRVGDKKVDVIFAVLPESDMPKNACILGLREMKLIGLKRNMISYLKDQLNCWVAEKSLLAEFHDISKVDSKSTELIHENLFHNRNKESDSYKNIESYKNSFRPIFEKSSYFDNKLGNSGLTSQGNCKVLKTSACLVKSDSVSTANDTESIPDTNIDQFLDDNGELIQTQMHDDSEICLNLTSRSDSKVFNNTNSNFCKKLAKNSQIFDKKVAEMYKKDSGKRQNNKKAKRVKVGSLTPEHLGILEAEEPVAARSDEEVLDKLKTKKFFENILKLPPMEKVQCMLMQQAYDTFPSLKENSAKEISEFVIENFESLCNKIKHVTTTNKGRIVASAALGVTIKAHDWEHVRVVVSGAAQNKVYEIHESLLKNTNVLSRLISTENEKYFDIAIVNNSPQHIKIKPNQPITVGHLSTISKLGTLEQDQEGEKVSVLTNTPPTNSPLTPEQLMR